MALVLAFHLLRTGPDAVACGCGVVRSAFGFAAEAKGFTAAKAGIGENSKHRTNQKLASLKADKEKQLEYKNTLDEQMENLQSQIAVLNEQIDTLDQNITEKTAQIADKQADIDFNYEQLKERLCALYKTGEASNLQILLNSEKRDGLSKTRRIY